MKKSEVKINPFTAASILCELRVLLLKYCSLVFLQKTAKDAKEDFSNAAALHLIRLPTRNGYVLGLIAKLRIANWPAKKPLPQATRVFDSSNFPGLRKCKPYWELLATFFQTNGLTDAVT
jgi:hypothetical protein